MSEGWKDIDLLAALASNNSPKFNQLIDRLRKEARDIATELLDGGSIEEAIDQAINKASDWLGTHAPFKVSHPMAYVKTLVRNAVIDYSRTHESGQISKKEYREIVAQVEGITLDNDEEDDEAGEDINQRRGWSHVVKGKGLPLYVDQVYPTREYPPREYPQHPWLRYLEYLEYYLGWLTKDQAYKYLKDKRKLIIDTAKDTMIPRTNKQVVRLLRQERDKRWQQYKVVMALLDSIPNVMQQEIMQHYLWGFSGADISKKLTITEPYISKVTKNWLNTWGWDKAQIQRVRFMLLTHNLAKIFSSISKDEFNKVERGIGAKITAENIKEHAWLVSHIEEITPDPRDQKEILEEWEPSGWHDYYLALKNAEKNIMDRIFLKVKESPQTRSYFSDMKDSDAISLIENCAQCYWYWYYSNPRNQVDGFSHRLIS